MWGAKMYRLLHVFGVLIFGMLIGEAAVAQDYRQFSKVGQWTIMKRPNGTCFAVTGAFQGDLFAISIRHDGVYLSLLNPKFHIPPGEYPVEVSLHGATIVPADTITLNALVEERKESFITIKLPEHQVRNLRKAALLSLTFAGKNHRLFPSDIENMGRELDLCARYDSDPLKSAR